MRASTLSLVAAALAAAGCSSTPAIDCDSHCAASTDCPKAGQSCQLGICVIDGQDARRCPSANISSSSAAASSASSAASASASAASSSSGASSGTSAAPTSSSASATSSSTGSSGSSSSSSASSSSAGSSSSSTGSSASSSSAASTASSSSSGSASSASSSSGSSGSTGAATQPWGFVSANTGYFNQSGTQVQLATTSFARSGDLLLGACGINPDTTDIAFAMDAADGTPTQFAEVSYPGDVDGGVNVTGFYAYIQPGQPRTVLVTATSFNPIPWMECEISLYRGGSPGGGAPVDLLITHGDDTNGTNIPTCGPVQGVAGGIVFFYSVGYGMQNGVGGADFVQRVVTNGDVAGDALPVADGQFSTTTFPDSNGVGDWECLTASFPP